MLTMAACNSPVQCTKLLRFSKECDLCVFHSDYQEDCGYLSVSGYHSKQKTSFIDVFKIRSDDKGRPLFKDKPFYSKEFQPNGSDFHRMTCSFRDTRIVICSTSKLRLFDLDTTKDRLIKETEFEGNARCMVVTDKMIYVGLFSRHVVVFDLDLCEQKTIKLTGLSLVDYPFDLAVCSEQLFICSNMWKVSKFSANGVKLEDFRPPTKLYTVPIAITVGHKTGEVYILWGARNIWGTLSADVSQRVVVKYSSSGGRFMAAFRVAVDAWKINSSDVGDRLFLLTRNTGDIYVHDVSDICNFRNTLTSLQLFIDKEECKRLIRRLKVQKEISNVIRESHDPSGSLLQYLRCNKKISEDDVTVLLAACSNEAIAKASEVLINYQHSQYHQYKRQHQRGKIQVSTEDVA